MAIDPIKDEMNGEADSRVAKVPKSMDEPVTGELQGVPSWAAWQEMWALWDQYVFRPHNTVLPDRMAGQISSWRRRWRRAD